MYSAVYGELSKEYEIERNNAAIKVRIKGKDIDVVPAMVESRNWAFLYKSDTGEAVRTNIPLHIHHVVNSGCLDIIKLMKIWKYNHQFEITSFVLELLTIQSLKGFKSENIEERFFHVLEYVSGNIQSINIVDPANPENIVSDKLSWTDRYNLATTANNCLSKTAWKDIIR